MAGVNADNEVVTRMRRQDTVYFSMVRRSACWASSVSDSAPFITITAGGGGEVDRVGERREDEDGGRGSRGRGGRKRG